ncbi:hypothetical protein CEXT_408861 [Caerostris extrusa]|uniref:Uncharacterized protein n=1 Tax=Caerostris extrusa TaxID=172846 RepID=A0AAV4QGL4_CAEEX|nr:hypothetical protein CEXT_408861 [Caerostris extrusa]
MDLSSLTFRIFNYISFGTRYRPKLRGTDCVEAHFKLLRATNCKTVVKQRLEWKKILGGRPCPPWTVELVSSSSSRRRRRRRRIYCCVVLMWSRRASDCSVQIGQSDCNFVEI